jgi:phage gp29-like protein
MRYFWTKTDKYNNTNQQNPTALSSLTTDHPSPTTARVPLKGRAVGGRFHAATLPTPGRETLPLRRENEYPPGGLETFVRMQRDPQIRACLTTKRLAVLSEDAEVHPADDSALARRAADIVRETLTAIPGGIAGIGAGALDALAMGHAVGELVWALDGSLESVRWHDPRRFVFHTDAFGNVLELEITDANLRLPRERFVLYAHQSRYGSPYGESDLTAAYRPWSQKEALERMWLSALDRFGAPIPVARVPLSWSQSEVDHLSQLLSRLQNESALVLTNDVQLDAPLDAGRTEPARAFATAAAWCNREIARAILGQELTSGTGDGASYALGRVHQAVCDDWIQALRTDLAERVLTAQVARTVTLAALGPDAPAPHITFPNLTPDELATRRTLLSSLLSGGIVAPTEGWIRRWIGVPE